MAPQSNAAALEKLLTQEVRHVAECCGCNHCETTDELDSTSFAENLAEEGWTEGTDEDGGPALFCTACDEGDINSDEDDEDNEE